jgi:hypothetical protein
MTALTLHPDAPRPGHGSPWGTIQHIEPLADGVVFVSTASHGGAWLSEEAQARMPAAIKPMHGRRWYEEDCETCAVLLIFGEGSGIDRNAAIASLAQYTPDWLDALAPVAGCVNAAQVRRIRDLHESHVPDAKPDFTAWKPGRTSGAIEGWVGGIWFTISAAGEAVG